MGIQFLYSKFYNWKKTAVIYRDMMKDIIKVTDFKMYWVFCIYFIISNVKSKFYDCTQDTLKALFKDF